MKRKISIVYDGGLDVVLDQQIRAFLGGVLGYEFVGCGMLLTTGERDITYEEPSEVDKIARDLMESEVVNLPDMTDEPVNEGMESEDGK